MPCTENPAFFGLCGHVKDAAQVRLLAQALWALSTRGGLAALLDVPAQTEEGWILGAGHVTALEGALR